MDLFILHGCKHGLGLWLLLLLLLLLQDMARFAAGLAGASVRVSTKPTPSGGPEGPYDPAEAASVFMVVPAPYVFDLLLQNLHEQKTESSRSS